MAFACMVRHPHDGDKGHRAGQGPVVTQGNSIGLQREPPEGTVQRTDFFFLSARGSARLSTCGAAPRSERAFSS